MRKGAGRGEMCSSPPPTVVLACSWVSSTGVVACLCVDELLLWPCVLGPAAPLLLLLFRAWPWLRSRAPVLSARPHTGG